MATPSDCSPQGRDHTGATLGLGLDGSIYARVRARISVDGVNARVRARLSVDDALRPTVEYRFKSSGQPKNLNS